MPLYNYKCKSCEHEFQHALKIANRKEPCDNPCPECGEETVYQSIKPVKFAYDGVGSNRHDSGFNDMLKEMRKKLPPGKIPLDDTIK